MIPRAHINKLLPFFKIEHDVAEITEKDLSSTVENLSITQKIGELLSGTLTVIDPFGLVNKVFLRGQNIKVTYGLYNVPLSILIPTADDEIQPGNFTRGPIKCHILTNKAQYKNGLSYLTITFRATSWETARARTRIFSDGTYRDVFTTLAEEMNASIQFFGSRVDAEVTKTNPFVQDAESNQSAMNRLYKELNVGLTYIYDDRNPNKIATVVVFDWDQASSVNAASIRGLPGQYHYFNYMGDEFNIIDGETSANFNSPNGSSFETFTGADGRISVRFIPSRTESTTAWVLDANKVRAALRSRSISSQAELVNQIVQSSQEDFLKPGGLREQYFTRVPYQTAPEGTGYTGNFNVVPNPIYMAGDRVWLGPKEADGQSGILPQYKTLKEKPFTVWTMNSIEDSISGGGYTQSVELIR